MAGGAGERFWPLSRQQRPKQLLCLTDPDRSMLREAVDRLTPMIPAEHIYIITSEKLAGLIREADPGIPPENVVAEPCKRNTAGALAYIAAHLLASHPERTPESISLAVNTADHAIGEPELFRKTLDAAMQAAEKRDALVTCGVVPDSPDTGFGYIQAIDARTAVGSEDIRVFSVKTFHEKPNRERAEDFVSNGSYFWNSGMFFWKISSFLKELDRVRPEISLGVAAMAAALKAGDKELAAEVFGQLDDISIDYALMEHANNVLMVRATFPWRDVGVWPHLANVFPLDAKGNCTVGEPVLIDSRNCIVYNASGNKQIAVGVAGIDDLVVVVTDDAVLVVPRDRAQDVRHIVKQLNELGADQV
ncbi:MAG: hypothetical protein GC168_07780 [Candidatus Hydrogenedens sp.]|nr:hypothetical protein [Candidatus Hydrogenedens sp.]